MVHSAYRLIFSSFMGEEIARKIDGGWIGKTSLRFYPDSDVIAWRELPPKPDQIGNDWHPVTGRAPLPAQRDAS